MKILNIDMIYSTKSVRCGIFAMNGYMVIDDENNSDVMTESVDAFRFFIQRGLLYE
jgi:hypothetical protein